MASISHHPDEFTEAADIDHGSRRSPPRARISS
jgi:hypothetical protein